VGQLGTLQRARPQGPVHVRPDDGRQLDLHRQPGHRAGHLRDLRRGRPPALQQRPDRQVDPHRRPGRHGRRPAAGRHAGRRLLAEHRMPAVQHRLPPAHPLRGQAGQGHRRRAGPDQAHTERARPSPSPCWAMPPKSCPSWSRAKAGGPARHRDRPDLGPRPDQRLPARGLDRGAVEAAAADPASTR
jgi:hypothetical protein